MKQNSTNPFSSLGHLCKSVKEFKLNAGPDPAKMMAAGPSTAGKTNVGSDGGFAVPPEYQKQIVAAVKNLSLLGLTDSREAKSNRTITPVDSLPPWDQENGVQAYWQDEVDQLQDSKPEIELHEGKLSKLTCMVPVTGELMGDAESFDAYLNRKISQKFAAAMNSAILAGNGVGRPLGILNSPCLIAVAKESNQTADTVVGANLLKMHGRWHSEPRNGAWLYHKTAEAQLLAAAGSAGILEPGFKILGLPLLPVQPCKPLGDQGDIVLADLAAYQTVILNGAMTVDCSIHKWFDTGLLAFRFILRVEGMPWWSAPISPENGSETLSPFVTLAERA